MLPVLRAGVIVDKSSSNWLLQPPSRLGFCISLVRNRAGSLLKAVSGLDFPQSDPIQWDQWWATNKVAFVPR